MKKLLKKSLLAVWLLMGGVNSVWAEASTIYEKAVTGWSSSDVTKTELTTDKWYNSTGTAKNNYLTGIYVTTTEGLRLISRNNGVQTAELKLNRSENTIVTIDAVWNAGASNNDANTPYNIFTYGDFSLKQTVRSNNYKTEYTINGVTTTIDSNSKVTYRTEGERENNGNELTIHLKVNTFNGQISEFYILAPDESELVNFSNLTSTTNHFTSEANYDIIRTTTFMSGSSAFTWNALKSITVKEEAQTIYTYKINAVDASNNILETLYEYQSLSEDSITQYWKKGLYKDGVWYMADAQTSTPHYGHTFTTGGTFNVTFRPTDVIYYAEAEDIASGLYDQENCANYTSNGNARFFQAKKNGKISTRMSLAAGLYDVFVAAIDRSGKSATLELYRKTTGGAETKIGVVKTSSNNFLYPNTFSNITFEADEELYSQPWTSTYNATFCLDYITVAKSKVTYTVKYMCGETEIKAADASRTAVWGTYASLTDEDKLDVFYDADSDGWGAIYEYVSDDAASQEIASDGSTIITVTFAEKPLYAQTNVTAAQTWDWSKVTETIQLSASTTPKKNDEFILKNIEHYRSIKIPATFGDAQMLKVTGEYPFRNNGGQYFQGSTIKFTSTVPGKLTVEFSNTGNNPARELLVNGAGTGVTSASTSKETAENIVICAGEVELKCSSNYFRFYKITFSTELTDVQRAILDCKTYETSAAFATAINSENFASVDEVYAFHTAWQIAQAKASGSTDLTKLIRNAAVADGTDWGGSSINHGEQYTGAPDEYYLDKWNGTINTNQTIYGVPAGTYKIKAATRSAANTSGTLYVNDGISDIAKVNQITSVGNTGGDLGNGWSWSEMTFTLTETKNLQVGFWADASSSKWAGCDDWHMELLSVTVTVGKNGYTTFASPYALDLTDENRPEGLKAYKATLSGSNLSFQQLHQTVPAGTGLLLLGETNDSTYNIPIVESGDDVETALTGVLTPTAKQSDEDGDYYFVMRKAKTAEEALTFAPITTGHAVTIPEGKVYVTVPSSAFVGGGARAIAVSFDDDETTGIDNLTPALSKGERVVYNLNGQRIDKPAKGLYIVNGKKVFVK